MKGFVVSADFESQPTASEERVTPRSFAVGGSVHSGDRPRPIRSRAFRSSPRHRVWLLAVLAGWFAVGCERVDGGFHLLEITPAPEKGALELNSTITLRFDREIDPSSVSSDTIELKCGESVARGRFEVDGKNVRFIPRPVSRADGADGGFIPGTTMKLVLRGFPARDGIFDREGRPLAHSRSAAFRIVEATAENAFLDVIPGRPPVVTNRERLSGNDPHPIRPDGWVRIAFSEPLLPSTVTASAVDLRYDNRERTPVAAEIQFSQGETTSEMLVRPVTGYQRQTRFLLSLVPGALTDPSGMPVDSEAAITVIGAEDGPERLGAEQESDRE